MDFHVSAMYVDPMVSIQVNIVFQKTLLVTGVDTPIRTHIIEIIIFSVFFALKNQLSNLPYNHFKCYDMHACRLQLLFSGQNQ